MVCPGWNQHGAMGIKWHQERTGKYQMSLTRQQITLLSIFSLFLAPLLLVMIMRSSWWDYQPAGLKNNGQLVQPPVALSPLPVLEGKWLLLYVISGGCDQKCSEDITFLRQIHKAAGRQREHLALVVLNTTGSDPQLQSSIESIYPAITFVSVFPQGTVSKLEQINASLKTAKNTLGDIHTYILDPMQNVILAYRADANPNDINKDLKRLLKWSKVD